MNKKIIAVLIAGLILIALTSSVSGFVVVKSHHYASNYVFDNVVRLNGDYDMQGITTATPTSLEMLQTINLYESNDAYNGLKTWQKLSFYKTCQPVDDPTFIQSLKVEPLPRLVENALGIQNVEPDSAKVVQYADVDVCHTYVLGQQVEARADHIKLRQVNPLGYDIFESYGEDNTFGIANEASFDMWAQEMLSQFEFTTMP